jgi:hypothetical protein
MSSISKARKEPMKLTKIKGSEMKVRFVKGCAALVAVGILGLGAATPALADDASCPGNYVCVWNQANFQGAKRVIGAGEAGTWLNFDNYKYSIKNQFSNRAVWTYAAYTKTYACFNPGVKTSSYFTASALYVAGPGSHC